MRMSRLEEHHSASAKDESATRVAMLEHALRHAEARFTGVVEIAADAIISVNEEQRITFFNEGAERIFGYSAEEVIGHPLDLLIPGRFRASHSEHVRAFGAGVDQSRPMGHRREISKGGAEFPAEASISKFWVGNAITLHCRATGHLRAQTERGPPAIPRRGRIASVGQVSRS